MTQNIYDDPKFFAKFQELKNSTVWKGGRVGVPDVDKLSELLPPLDGKKVLDLGCGDGWFSRWARDRGASTSHAVDVSESMLNEARKATEDKNITFARVDLNQPRGLFDSEAYDIVFSSLVVHWVKDLPTLVEEVHRCLKPGGTFYFSIEHPMRTAPHSAKVQRDQQGKAFWPISDYADEGQRIVTWVTEGVIKQHRTIESYMTGVLQAGFEIIGFKEWGWSDQGNHTKQEWYIPRDVIPGFLMFLVRKKTC